MLSVRVHYTTSYDEYLWSSHWHHVSPRFHYDYCNYTWYDLGQIYSTSGLLFTAKKQVQTLCWQKKTLKSVPSMGQRENPKRYFVSIAKTHTLSIAAKLISFTHFNLLPWTNLFHEDKILMTKTRKVHASSNYINYQLLQHQRNCLSLKLFQNRIFSSRFY